MTTATDKLTQAGFKLWKNGMYFAPKNWVDANVTGLSSWDQPKIWYNVLTAEAACKEVPASQKRDVLTKVMELVLA